MRTNGVGERHFTIRASNVLARQSLMKDHRTMKIRIPRGQVSGRRKERALKVLSDLVDNPKTADHVKQKAASALISVALREEDAEPERDPDAPRTFIVMPAGRSRLGPNHELVPVAYGLTGSETQSVVLVPNDYRGDPLLPTELFAPWHEADLAEIAAEKARARANAAARLALPSPDHAVTAQDGDSEAEAPIAA
jgi:hypothetical protein